MMHVRGNAAVVSTVNAVKQKNSKRSKRNGAPPSQNQGSVTNLKRQRKIRPSARDKQSHVAGREEKQTCRTKRALSERPEYGRRRRGA